MKKFLSMGVAIALALGFASCNNERGNTPDSTDSQLDTYVGVRIAFSGVEGMRALPEDHNKKFGEWKGRDEIKKITVYLVNETKQRVDFSTFNEGSFEGIQDGFLKPTLAVKATEGEKVKAYAVINDLKDLTKNLATVAWNEFDAKFKELELTVTSIADVATYNDSKEIVMMTNDKEAAAIDVVKATKKEAIEGTKNRADIVVSRVVSRAIMTKDESLKEENKPTIKVKNSNGKEISTITITDIKYAVGQSNLKFYNMYNTGWKTPDPVYSYVPSGNDWSTNNKKYFDYSDLKSSKDLQAITYGQDGVHKALGAEEFSKFVLPVTHKTGNYKKGNMTYFELTCKFTVDKVYGEDGAVETNVAGQNVFLGMSDGKFYKTRALAEAKGQQATKYKAGVMKYVLWLNPNGGYAAETKITESPTVRNQVYHAHISGFKEIGVPNNPLNPDDPNDPENPENPINPNDNPETEKTYLSVSIRVLPWTIHSYSVDVSNRY
ncbi:Mfa1 family fimbria major subunit [Porphyromonas levii]|uniref:Mfa1 family fimbria major subunit n=1 Tax=Porphyromonas levii TaxID=28114 RepID=UPI001BACB9D1|nr:Mfa1 family fimbria major subunit [Porphyromonas levii]MBR8766228.1 Minor fimbrium subunit Mfa1 [Porphyromonas levii]MBR8807655.1 Minor fimbrium subunit Mfa1 [Porphyromonas levii]